MDHIGKDHAKNWRVDLATEEGEKLTFRDLFCVHIQVCDALVCAFSARLECWLENDISPPEVVSDDDKGIAGEEEEDIGRVDNLWRKRCKYLSNANLVNI